MLDQDFGDIIDGKCSKCGHVWESGDWPMCPHGKSLQTSPFRQGWDDGLGEYVTSLGQRKTIMRQHKLEYRDHPPKGQQSARLDKIHERQRDASR